MEMFLVAKTNLHANDHLATHQTHDVTARDFLRKRELGSVVALIKWQLKLEKLDLSWRSML